MLDVLDRILLCCIPGMLYVIYVLKHANRADFSTISIFVKTLMPQPQKNCLPLVISHVHSGSVRACMVSSILETMPILGFRIPGGDVRGHL